MHICVRAITSIFPLDFGTVPTMWYFFVFNIIDNYIFWCLSEPRIDSQLLYRSIYRSHSIK